MKLNFNYLLVCAILACAQQTGYSEDVTTLSLDESRHLLGYKVWMQRILNNKATVGQTVPELTNQAVFDALGANGKTAGLSEDQMLVAAQAVSTTKNLGITVLTPAELNVAEIDALASDATTEAAAAAAAATASKDAGMPFAAIKKEEIDAILTQETTDLTSAQAKLAALRNLTGVTAEQIAAAEADVAAQQAAVTAIQASLATANTNLAEETAEARKISLVKVNKAAIDDILAKTSPTAAELMEAQAKLNTLKTAIADLNANGDAADKTEVAGINPTELQTQLNAKNGGSSPDVPPVPASANLSAVPAGGTIVTLPDGKTTEVKDASGAVIASEVKHDDGSVTVTKYVDASTTVATNVSTDKVVVTGTVANVSVSTVTTAK